MSKMAEYATRARRALELSEGIPDGKIPTVMALDLLQKATAKVDDKGFVASKAIFKRLPLTEQTPEEWLRLLDDEAVRWRAAVHMRPATPRTRWCGRRAAWSAPKR